MSSRAELNKHVTEADFAETFRQLATLRGWRAYHTADSRRSESGFPDWVLVRNGRLLFVELKKVGGKTTTAQDAWLHDLTLVEGKVALADDSNAQLLEVHLWTPADWPAIEAALR